MRVVDCGPWTERDVACSRCLRCPTTNSACSSRLQSACEWASAAGALAPGAEAWTQSPFARRLERIWRIATPPPMRNQQVADSDPNALVHRLLHGDGTAIALPSSPGSVPLNLLCMHVTRAYTSATRAYSLSYGGRNSDSWRSGDGRVASLFLLPGVAQLGRACAPASAASLVHPLFVCLHDVLSV